MSVVAGAVGAALGAEDVVGGRVVSAEGAAGPEVDVVGVDAFGTVVGDDDDVVGNVVGAVDESDVAIGNVTGLLAIASSRCESSPVSIASRKRKTLDLDLSSSAPASFSEGKSSSVITLSIGDGATTGV